jgi:Thiamine pyrophosphate enzyme, N-terminal TPP binding domain
MNGAESLLRALVGSGVEVCFGNPGTSEMHFVAALDRVEGMRVVITARGMKAMAPKMAHPPARNQLKYKDPKSWREYLSRLEQHSPIGMSNTLARFQSLRSSLFEFSDEFSRMAIPILKPTPSASSSRRPEPNLSRHWRNTAR